MIIIIIVGILLFVAIVIYMSFSLKNKKNRDIRYIQDFVKAYEEGLVIFDTETTGLDVMNEILYKLQLFTLKMER